MQADLAQEFRASRGLGSEINARFAHNQLLWEWQSGLLIRPPRRFLIALDSIALIPAGVAIFAAKVIAVGLLTASHLIVGATAPSRWF